MAPIRLFILAVWLSSFMDSLSSQDTKGLPVKTSTSYGTEFWIPFPAVSYVTSSFQYRIYVTNPNSTQINVTVTFVMDLSSTNQTLTLSATDSQFVTVDNSFMLQGEVLSRSYAALTGQISFGVYVIGTEKMGAFIALPVASWGRNYTAVTYCGQSDGPCQIVIIAKFDTQVEIKLPVHNVNAVTTSLNGLKSSPTVVSLTLTPGNVYQFQRYFDITGTTIESTAPIGVLGGSASTLIGQGHLAGAINAFLPPINTMGSSYVVFLSPGSTGVGDLVRVVALKYTTNVWISTDYQSFQLKASQYITRRFTKSLILVEADQPILVVTYTQSSDVRYPTMTCILPTDLYLQGDTVVVPLMNDFKNVQQFAVVVATVDFMQQNKLWIDGNLAGTNMAVSVINMFSKSYTLDGGASNTSFMIYSYLVSQEVTSLIPVAFCLSEINPPCSITEDSPGDYFDNDCDGQIDEDVCDDSNYKSFKDCGTIVSGDADIWGKAFTFQVPDHCPSYPDDDNILLYMSARSSMTVSVTVKTPLDLAKVNRTLSLLASDQFISLTLTGVNIKSTGSQIIADQTLQVTSSEEISVILMQICPESGRPITMTTRLMPVDVLGREYFAVTFCVPDLCQIQVTAYHKGVTDMRIRLRLQYSLQLPPFTFNSQEYQDGDVILVSLNQFQSLQLQSQRDMTGTHILATKPVSVFSGGRKTFFLKQQVIGSFVNQLPPVRSWGRNFIVQQSPTNKNMAKCNGPCRDSLKIVACTGETVINFYGINNTVETLVTAGDSLLFNFTSDYYVVSSTKPIQIMQITQEVLKTAMSASIVSPTDQYQRTDRVVIPPVAETYLMIGTAQTGASANVIIINNISATMNMSSSSPLNASFYIYNNTNNVSFAEITSPSPNEFVFGGHVYLRSIFSAGLFQLTHAMTEINPVCIVSKDVGGDKIDNDCDGQVDEEPCDPPDEAKDVDNDGMMNEDCMEVPVSSMTIEPSSTSVFSETDIEQIPASPSWSIESSTMLPFTYSQTNVEQITSSPSWIIESSSMLPFTYSQTNVEQITSSPSWIIESSSMLPFTYSQINVEQITSSPSSALTETEHGTPASVSNTISEATTISTSSTTLTTKVVPSVSMTVSTSFTSATLPSTTEAYVSIDNSTTITTTSKSLTPPTAGTATPKPVITNEVACSCHCPSNIITAVLDSNKVNQKIADIQKELYLDKDDVSANKRRYVSIGDKRPSAQTFGYLGLSVILATLIGIFVLDAKVLTRDFVGLMRRCRGKH